MNIESISNDGLVDALKTFIGHERELVAQMVVYLAEVEKRGIHLARACSSMNEFCLRVLGMSDVGSSRVDLQACKLEYSIVSPK